MDPLTIAFGLANNVPDILKWLGHDNAAQSVAKIVQIAQQVTGKNSGAEALQAVKDNPTYALNLQQALVAQRADLAKFGQAVTLAAMNAEIENTKDVNATMRAEVAAEHWPTYTWRPFIGFCFGTSLLISVIVVAVAYIAVLINPAKAELLKELPGFLTSMSVLLAMPMPVLGIASYFRGKMQADPDIPTVNRG